MIKERKYILSIFVFILICLCLLPISGDDWGNYVLTHGNIVDSIKEAINYYYTWEGRFISRIVLLIFTYHKFIYNIIVAIAICSIFYVGINLVGKVKNVSVYILFFIAIFGINPNMFAQCYLWIAGSGTYLLPMVINLLYFFYIYTHHDKKYNKVSMLILLVVNIIGTMFVENIACSLVFGNILVTIYYYIYKDEKKTFSLICTIISIITLSIMLLSPGSAERSLVEGSEIFKSLNLIEKIFYNLENFSTHMILNNIVMLILMLCIINYTISRFFCKHRKKLYLFFNLIPLLSIILNIKSLMPFYIDSLYFNLPDILDFSSVWYLFYWILFFAFFLYCIYLILNKYKTKMMFLYFLILISLVSILVMLILPVWYERIAFFPVIVLSIVCVVLLNEVEISRKNVIVLFGILIFMVIYYFICFFATCRINQYRVEEINSQKEKRSNEIKVLYQPFRFLWNNNLPSEYFVKKYKEYLIIDSNVKLVIYKPGFKKYLEVIF